MMTDMYEVNQDLSKTEIQENWKRGVIGDVCEVVTGGTPSTKIREYFDDGTIPWMKSGDIHQEFIFDVPGRITKLGLENSAAKMYPRNSVVNALSGRGITRGMTAVLMVPCTSSQSVAAIIPDEDFLNPEFLHYYLRSQYKTIRSLTGDNDRSGLNLGLVRSINIHFPPLPEQRAIAHVLTTVRNAIEATEKVIEVVKELKRSMMKHLFTYGPIPINQIDQVRLKETEIGDLPEEWRVEKLENIISFSRKPREIDLSDFNDIPFIPMDAIPEDGIHQSYFISKSSLDKIRAAR
jgi:type I restriction enzyme S subunit